MEAILQKLSNKGVKIPQFDYNKFNTGRFVRLYDGGMPDIIMTDTGLDE